LTAISAAKTGVPINAMAAIAIASFFMAAPEKHTESTIRPAGGLLPLQHSEHEIIGNPADVRFGSKADIAPRNLDVRFTPKSGHC
jgi:hypothetical protein